jgi:opacity protein-like surface antigen
MSAPRFTQSAPWLLSAVLLFTPIAQAEGGFVSLQAGITDSQDMDSFGTAYKIHFGANILDQFALEFGLLDMGEAGYDNPVANFDDVDADTPPRFDNADHGSVSRSPGTDTEQAKATFTGISTAHPQGLLITFRYKFNLAQDIDFFLKTGANIWQAEYDIIEMTATQDGNVTNARTIDSRKTSAVDQISGGGFLWSPLDNMAIRAELETTALDSKEFERVRFQLLTLGVQYEF